MDFVNIDSFFEIEPYSLDKNLKSEALEKRISYLHNYHYLHCPPYRNFTDFIKKKKDYSSLSYEDLPYLPIRIFKQRTLKSFSKDNNFKLITSSGTSGQQVSQIFLDRETSVNQQKAMIKIVSSFIGSSKMPMLVIDCENTIKDRTKVSARAAGILGFSLFGIKRTFALDNRMRLDFDTIFAFLEKYSGRKILLFGFTYVIWQYFYKELLEYYKSTNKKLDLSNAILIHGGGWKKLESQNISSLEFKKKLKELCNINEVYNYYGMAEQTGSIFMECEFGHLHASIFSDVIVRNPVDFSICEDNTPGVVQVISTIPTSYPGFSLLTDDTGVILGEDNCPCGRLGKFFKILGRLKKAEIRGCSDTLESKSVIETSTNNNYKEESNHAYGELSGLHYVVGSNELLKTLSSSFSTEAFSDEVMDFLSEWSNCIINCKDSNKYTDVRAFAFYIRRSSLNQIKRKQVFLNNCIYMGRGLSFHIAPSNVPVNFAYSLFSALICGNSCVLKLPSKSYEQIDILVNCLTKAMDSYPQFKKRIILVRYNREKYITDFFSSICNIRVIWGGDKTIAEVRESKLSNPRATEVTFANRYSICIIDSDLYLTESDKHRFAHDFYNDTYLSNQNACTSPKIVIWTGRHKKEAKKLFWNYLYDVVQKLFSYEPIMGLDKYNLLCSFSMDDEFKDDSFFINSDSNLITRVNLSHLYENLCEYYGKFGFFYEYDCDDLEEIVKFLDSQKLQTICFLGDISQLKTIFRRGCRGIDRVVSIGRSLDFSLVWDGNSLVNFFTREISFEK